MTIHHRAKSLLNFIASHEAPEGYDQVYGGSRLWPERNITGMTIDQVLAWQDASVAVGSRSSAAGRYQIIRKTLRSLKGMLGLTGAEFFDPEMQDRMAFALLKGRGWADFAAGRVSEDRFGNAVAAEWASLPMLSGPKRGRSRYDGDGLNSALTSVEAYRKALRGFA